ncbi:MAG: hypothetical protein HY700_14780 [Gemmatimonadetes bacterium]|nr:hypothetical protein [Gemmatimonadota bacterium]
MSETRYAHAAATGADGRIYVFSGLRRAVLTTAEKYDPAQDSWSPSTDPGAQGAAGAVLGFDGRIYLVGGADGSLNALNSVQAYSPERDTWVAVAGLSHPRFSHAVTVAADGRIYALGGVDGSAVLKTGEVSSSAVDKWDPIAEMSVERQAFGAVAGRDGRIYVFAGMTPAGATAASEVYDPAGNAWSPIANMPEARYGHAAARGGDDLLYVFGGRVDGVPRNSVLAYNPADNSWSSIAPMNAARFLPAAAAGNDGYVYVTGGRSDGNVVVASAERYLTAVPNRAPVAAAGADQTLECEAGCAVATLDGSASSDPDNDQLSYQWSENGTVIASGSTASVQLGLGSHAITLRVTDDRGASAEDEVVITVADTRAPVIAFNQLLREMWAPNHSLRLAAVISASDACEGVPNLQVSVSSNEAVNGTGDGDTAPDWELVPTENGVEIWLRAERDGSGLGRVYTITATAADQSGNHAEASGNVIVPSNSLRPEARRRTKTIFVR